MTDEEDDDKEKMLDLFISLIRSMGYANSREEALYQLAELRSEIAINKAFDGFNIEPEDALDLVREMDLTKLSEEDIEKRARLIAAISNLIEFAACEEYQLYKDVEELGDDYSREDWADVDLDDPLSPFLLINKKYNETYANVEDADIEYAMAMAYAWIGWGKNATLTYMTQNDERVRPWHYALQGFTAKRDEFPAWMIPPIEWACRCYLSVDYDIQAKLDLNILNKKSVPERPKELDGIFKESVCKCGRIFSDEHPYFQIDDKDEDLLKKIVERLRLKYYGQETI